jgi:hypothetical protein
MLNNKSILVTGGSVLGMMMNYINSEQLLSLGKKINNNQYGRYLI